MLHLFASCILLSVCFVVVVVVVVVVFFLFLLFYLCKVLSNYTPRESLDGLRTGSPSLHSRFLCKKRYHE